MIALTKGRTALNCRDNVGGIKNVYLAKFELYNNLEIVRDKQTVTSFPNTNIYDFWTNNAVFTEQSSEDGYKYDQSLNFTLLKSDLITSQQLYNIKDLYFRCILEFNDGSLRILGLYNGLNLTYSDNSGGSKSEGTKYNITLTGNEEISAPYLNDLSDFNLTDIEYLLLDDGQILELDNGRFLILD